MNIYELYPIIPGLFYVPAIVALSIYLMVGLSGLVLISRIIAELKNKRRYIYSVRFNAEEAQKEHGVTNIEIVQKSVSLVLKKPMNYQKAIEPFKAYLQRQLPTLTILDIADIRLNRVYIAS